MRFVFCFICFSTVLADAGKAQLLSKPVITEAGKGWAGNSINTTIFRKNAICSYKNWQYIAYYSQEGYVVLGKRALNSPEWKLTTTSLKGNIADAHNGISIMVDGEGYLHMAWNHHNNQLHYCKSKEPGSLQMSNEQPMTGSLETKVTYPEFHRLPHGNLLFIYRDGQSGKGNLVINRYHTKKKQWKQLHDNLIDGEGKRNAYWQACVDNRGTIHLSWVWRESPDVASNHDMCYAKSEDGGMNWQKSTGEKYRLPVNAASAEYICKIPERSELINQTSMYAGDDGVPFIASYWKEKDDTVPQYHVIYKTGSVWRVQNLGTRTTSFTLSGAGTKRIPISRPQIIAEPKNSSYMVMLIYRDEESGSKVSVAYNEDIRNDRWKVEQLTDRSVGSWEPSYDTELWKQKKRLNLFVQYTEQIDREGKAAIPAQPAQVISTVILKKTKELHKRKLIFEDDFSDSTLSSNWVIEKSSKEDSVCTITKGQLQLNSEGGVTVWFKHELKGNILIEYDRTVVMENGRYDRLSDLNQFWMVTDPQQKMFTRQGGFREYDSLQMYYVGMGGNYNTTTRMRRYDGKGTLQIVGEYTDGAHLLTPNKNYHISIKVEKGVSSFMIDDEIYFSYNDNSPLTHGWFAIRSTKSRQMIDNIKIWQLD